MCGDCWFLRCGVSEVLEFLFWGLLGMGTGGAGLALGQVLGRGGLEGRIFLRRRGFLGMMVLEIVETACGVELESARG